MKKALARQSLLAAYSIHTHTLRERKSFQSFSLSRSYDYTAKSPSRNMLHFANNLSPLWVAPSTKDAQKYHTSQCEITYTDYAFLATAASYVSIMCWHISLRVAAPFTRTSSAGVDWRVCKRMCMYSSEGCGTV